MTKETAGKKILDISSKVQDVADTIELEQELNAKDFDANLIEMIEKHKKIFSGDFYIEIILRFERALNWTPYRLWKGRQDAPPPSHDQSVFRYNRSEDRVEFLWTIPDGKACQYLRANRLVIPEEHKDLAQFCFDYHNGTLSNKAKTLNSQKEIYDQSGSSESTTRRNVVRTDSILPTTTT